METENKSLAKAMKAQLRSCEELISRCLLACIYSFYSL